MSNKHASSNGKKRRRSPPPQPPQALVNLLRTDASVLEYFTQLETNLNADVNKWKTRALSYKQECKNLHRQLQQVNQEGSRKKLAPQKQKKKASKPIKRKTSPQTKSAAKTSPQENAATTSVENDKRQSTPTNDNDDNVFVFSSDSDVDLEETEKPMQEDSDWTTYGLLLEAFNNMRQLGVALVIEQEDDDDNLNEKEHAMAIDNGSIKYLRRSDNDVVTDLIHAMYTLSRIQLHLQHDNDCKTYAPFSTDTRHVVCCNNESHPAAMARECALQALCVMDTYCTYMSESEWNKLFPPASAADEAIRIGMRNRHQLVNLFKKSLIGEVSSAVLDRSSRIIHTALHYEASEDDAVVAFGGTFGPKSQVRLSNLAAKCLLAQLVTSVLHHRDEHQVAASLIWRYILSTVPSFGVEEYPRFPPVFSLVVLESLLRPYAQSIALLHCLDSSNNEKEDSSLLNRAIALAIHACAFVWKQRLASSDDRISDVSRVELAAFDRLLESPSFGPLNPENSKKSVDACCSNAKILLKDALSWTSQEESLSAKKVKVSFAVQLALIVMGDTKLILETCNNAIGGISRDWIPLACCSAFRQLQVRQIDTFRAKQGSLVKTSVSSGSSVSDQLADMVDKLRVTFGPSPGGIDVILKCFIQLSDGENLYKLLSGLSTCEIGEDHRTKIATVIAQCLGTPFTDVRYPTIRVINLQRRPDRIKTFMAQAQSHRILVSKAVARLDANDTSYSLPNSSTSNINFDTTYVWGLHALDGLGSKVEVVSRLSKEIGDSRVLTDFVESHWRPNDLKAFDKDARNDESLVPLSPSECACALSHIASWKGVYRSLSTTAPQSPNNPRHGTSFPFLISGYARGQPIIHSNEQMPPAPICVILEDDAILVDRFVDRLSTLLEELPRDFHFCSIGYSRPKAAPIAKYSTHLGIPSCTWYLTGYILSLEGAKHLLECLPVRGPVDSWIGLKMCANWDNVFGQAIGVGARVASATAAELPSRKDLARILKFRAFAALVPLCSQKVDATANTTAGRSWRQRDTDVTYSGNL